MTFAKPVSEPLLQQRNNIAVFYTIVSLPIQSAHQATFSLATCSKVPWNFQQNLIDAVTKASDLCYKLQGDSTLST